MAFDTQFFAENGPNSLEFRCFPARLLTFLQAGPTEANDLNIVWAERIENDSLGLRTYHAQWQGGGYTLTGWERERYFEGLDGVALANFEQQLDIESDTEFHLMMNNHQWSLTAPLSLRVSIIEFIFNELYKNPKPPLVVQATAENRSPQRICFLANQAAYSGQKAECQRLLASVVDLLPFDSGVAYAFCTGGFFLHLDELLETGLKALQTHFPAQWQTQSGNLQHISWLAALQVAKGELNAAEVLINNALETEKKSLAFLPHLAEVMRRIKIAKGLSRSEIIQWVESLHQTAPRGDYLKMLAALRA